LFKISTKKTGKNGGVPKAKKIVSRDLGRGNKTPRMADATKSHGSGLLRKVRQLFEQHNYAAVCRMQGEIDKWQCAQKLQRLYADQQTYAEVVFFLASAMSMKNVHDKAIHYYKIAYTLHMSFVSAAQAYPAATRDELAAAHTKLAKVCS